MLCLHTHYQDICKIVGSKFQLPPDQQDDLIQKTCEKILHLNLSEHSYNPDKASPSTYIYMVARSLFISTHRSQSKFKTWTQDVKYLQNEEADFWKDLVLQDAKRSLEGQESLVLEKKLQGYTQEEIMEDLQISHYQIKRLSSFLKTWASSIIEP